MITRMRLALPLLALLAIAACGGGTTSQNFLDCGNNRLDSGEGCDDGNRDDTDACTTACQKARCGDGVVQAAVEDCDGADLKGGTCATLGLSGKPACTAACRYDYSVCGPTLPTPTATFTAAPPTATPTASPTVTATPASACGDGLLNTDETCAGCPADCSPHACEASPNTAVVNVSVAIPSGSIKQLRISLYYRTSVVGLPNTGLQTRFQAVTGVLVRPTDQQYFVDVPVAAQGQGTLASGPVFAASFDRCGGAAPPTAADFACIVTNCGTASGCTCNAAVP